MASPRLLLRILVWETSYIKQMKGETNLAFLKSEPRASYLQKVVCPHECPNNRKCPNE